MGHPNLDHLTMIRKHFEGGGGHSTEVAFALLTQQPRVQFPAFPKIFDVAEIY